MSELVLTPGQVTLIELERGIARLRETLIAMPEDANISRADLLQKRQLIERILDDRAFIEQCRDNLGAVAAELSWDTVVQPLVDFCRREDTFAMAPNRRRLQAYTRGGMYFALKNICQRDRKSVV